MEPIRFAHISDTHLRTQAPGDAMADMFDRLPDPDTALAGLLDTLAQQDVDFVIATGDLVHEGVADDYRRMRALVEEHLPRTPFIVCLGNHDHKDAFFEGYLDSAPQPSYHAVRGIDGLRVLVIDSACGGGESGAFSEAELDWLEAMLATPAPRGTLLAYHHPVSWDGGHVAMKAPQRFLDLVGSGDVIAILNGHTHMNDVRHLAGIPQITADSTAFGSAMGTTTFDFTNRAGYASCALDETGLCVRMVPLFPVPDTIGSIPWDAMLKILNT